MKHPPPLSLYAFLLAGLLFLAAMIGLDGTARFLVGQYSHAFAAGGDNALLFFTESSALVQQVAFERSDILPVYGSSELDLDVANRPGEFFLAKPTGFLAFPVGKAGATPLSMTTALANVGDRLRDKKLVIIISPTWALWGDAYNHSYMPNSSEQDLDGVLFSPSLSLPFKRELARRLLQIPNAFRRNPTSAWAAIALATDDLPHTLLYDALLPYGILKTAGNRIRDTVQTLDTLSQFTPAALRPPVSQPAPDWNDLLARARSDYAAHSDNNPYGVDNDQWNNTFRARMPAQAKVWSETKFDTFVQTALMWQDLDLLLRELHELGAHPLILNIPFNGKYYDGLGIPAPARALYYDKLRQAVAPYHDVKLLDFQDREYDRYLFLDPNAHLSPAGWGIYDQAIDTFYHESLR